MEYWLRQRGFQIVPVEDICIPDFKMPQDLIPMNQSAAVPELPFRIQVIVDKNIPHAIGRFCHDTVTVRVVASANRKQCFLLVRDDTSANFPKKELVDICDNFLRFAPCIIIANRISPTSLQTIRDTTQKHGFGVELLSIQDVQFDKLQSDNIPHYRVLTTDEVANVETKKKCKSADFPRMLASDSIAKYCKFIPGNVLEKCDKHSGELSYRIVTTVSGVVPQTHTTSHSPSKSTTTQTQSNTLQTPQQ